ncbi:hypothetical protein ACFVV7_04790 [Streptomyces globisporus]|uniref:hypothetical protein n=1 Tax=Streptomyces globisporus TaxID=1908 RepID=UPI0036DBDD14
MQALELNGRIRTIAFETDDAIDDLTLSGDGFQFFIQAKRTISLSELDDSEYSSVIDQFVRQYTSANKTGQRYILATSPSSSSRITKDLRKITTAARLNEDWTANPLTKNENEALEKTKKLLKLHYKKITASEISDSDLAEIFRRIYVAVLDVEEGGSLEQAVFFLLAGNSAIPPQLLWGGLVTLGLTLARDRLSIDETALRERMGKHFGSYTAAQSPMTRETFFELTYMIENIAAGREVVLVEYPEDGADVLLAELRRFSDDGSRRVAFVGDEVRLANDLRWKLIGRFATMKGAQRHIEGNIEQFRDKDLVIAPINSNEDFDATPHALTHAAFCREDFRKNTNPFTCLNCGEFISEDMAPFIEVDEEGLPYTTGFVHQGCLRPTYRVLGGMSSELFRNHALLKNFNYETWYQRIQRGQSVFRSPVGKPIAFIARDPHHNDFSTGKWCVRIDLEDGSSRYLTERSRVVRRSQADAESDAGEMNRGIREAQSRQNPMCYSKDEDGVVGEYYGTYSYLTEIGQNPVACLEVKAVPYTRSIAEAYSEAENFYAPLAFLSDAETGDPIIIADVLSLLTNPLDLEKYTANWSKAGIELPEFTVSILETDERFDRFMNLLEVSGARAIVDPLLAPNGDLIRGYIVSDNLFLRNSAKDS